MDDVSYWPGEIYSQGQLWAVDEYGTKVRTIPFNESCRHCGQLTWGLELGAKDRWWGGDFICRDCMAKQFKRWIGLISPDGNQEWNARFLLGDERAEALKEGEFVLLKGKNGKPMKYRVSYT